MKNKTIPLTVLIAGIIGGAMRWLLYAITTDAKNLIPLGNPLAIILWIVTAAVVILVLASILPLRNAENDRNFFRAHLPAALGSLAGSAGIGMTVATSSVVPDGVLGLVWKVLGIASMIALILVSFCRAKGKVPFFGMHLIVCIFFAVHLVTSYRSWSSNPQLMDYVFTLFASLGMMLFAFYHSCLEAGMAKLRLLPIMGLLAAYCCLVTLSGTSHFLLYLGCSIWALTNLCHLYAENDSQEASV